MKATKLILIVAFLSFAAMGFSKEDVKSGPLTITISLEKAVENPRLVSLMYQQLDSRVVLNQNPGELPRIITAKVKTRLAVYVIFGTLDAWKEFFKKQLSANPKM